MNEKNFTLAEKYVPHGYIQQGKEARKILEKKIHQLLEQGKLPIEGWSDISIQHLLQEIALMDSNNFPENCGVGEREARIASDLVAKRHYYFGHGIGRSGDISEVQPKAAGSSLINKLTNCLVLDLIKMTGVQSAKSCLVVPVATGMALVLSMLALKEQRPSAKYVIWPRIDQKSCFKSIITAGLQPLIIENLLVGDHLETDLFTIRETIEDKGHENILCIMTTTSCFAPRIPDNLEEVAILCKEFAIPHLVNNAYGIQASKCMHLLQQANRVGRVDAFVQSTDKNFMVPVGGAVIASFDRLFIQDVSKIYPGRASASPILDVFITLLSLGANGYKKYLKERKELYEHLQTKLQILCEQYGERLLESKQNQISLAISLTTLDSKYHGDSKKITEFGSFLFKRSVSGTRVITPSGEKVIGGYIFKGWGAHHKQFPCSYLTAAAAIGATRSDADLFLTRLEKALKHFPFQYQHVMFTQLAPAKPVLTKTLSDPKVAPQLMDRASMNRANIDRAKRARSLPRRYNRQCFSDDDIREEEWPTMMASKSDSNLQPSRKDNLSFKFRKDDDKYIVESNSDDDSAEFHDELAQQVVLPGKLPEDKMSFLIDI